MNQNQNYQPSSAFVLVSWAVLIVGVAGFLIGLWNAEMGIEEKGYYFSVLALGLFAAVSVQKSVRDRIEGIPVSDIYYGICWACSILAVSLLAIGLFKATTIDLSEKGFYAMAYVLSMFAAITVQKNTRDVMQVESSTSKKPVPYATLPAEQEF